MEGSLKTSYGVGLAFYDRFDPAVVEIPHEPGQSFPSCLVLGEEPKADALDLTAHEKPASDDHRVNSGRLIIADCPRGPASGLYRLNQWQPPAAEECRCATLTSLLATREVS